VAEQLAGAWAVVLVRNLLPGGERGGLLAAFEGLLM